MIIFDILFLVYLIVVLLKFLRAKLVSYLKDHEIKGLSNIIGFLKKKNEGLIKMSLQKTRDFMLQEKMISLKDKGKIMNLDKEVIGTFAGKLIKIGNTYRIRDLDETPVLTVHEKVISMRSSYTFYEGGEQDDDKYIGKLKRKIVSVKPSYWFEDPKENKVFTMKGNIFTLKFKILKDNKVVAEIHKKLFKSLIKGTYGIKMSPDLDDDSAMLVLGIVLMLHHEKEENR